MTDIDISKQCELEARLEGEQTRLMLRDAVLEEAALKADEWFSAGEMKLRAGEMTAQEVRTVKAVVSAIARSIRRLKSISIVGS